jgi:hypothetical protein
MRKSRRLQVEKLPADLRLEYFRYRRKAILFGFAHLWTFPLFSWPTLYTLVFPLNANAYMAEKVTSMQVVVIGAIPLFIAMASFNSARKTNELKAKDIRLGQVAESTQSERIG